MENGYIEPKSGKRWIVETQEISKMIGGLIRTKNNFQNKE
jgi:hypothetical protein